MKAISLARIFPDHPNHRLAFTRQSLTVIKDLLAAHTTASDSPLFLTASPPSLVSSASTDGEYRARKGSTAILVGLCNADGIASILFQIRSPNFRAHAGELGFPGGKVERNDPSLFSAAVRETQEELGIQPLQIERLGDLKGMLMDGTGKLRIHPFIAFIHPRPTPTLAPAPSDDPIDDSSLPSLIISSLIIQPSEVLAPLVLPLRYALDSRNLRASSFRNNRSRPYWVVNAEDVLKPETRLVKGGNAVSLGEDEAGEKGRKGPDGETLEVWGLSG